ncbi:universal stress protein [Streptacidiphilus monticola]|uniref:Universal stress protein n=1 Tax=Streptacidiphilus monticola TaxID=2161674 RepID=A0ABW1G6U4_9ACTN
MAGFLVAGVDGSPAGERAARWAAEEAMGRGCDLRLVASHPRAERALDLTGEQLRQALPALSVQVSRRWVEQPGTGVEEVAPSDAVMTVLGCGHGLPDATVRQVTTHAACPVVLARRGGDPTGPVVVGVNAERVLGPLEFALQHARARGAAVVALHAWSASQQTSYFAEPASETDTAERCGELREELALLFAPLLDGYGDVPTTLTVRHGGAAGLLLEAGEKASLLVLGRTAVGPRWRPHLGTVPYSVIPLAACSVAVVPHD